MRIKKILISVITISIIVIVFITILTNSRSLWKIFGYSLCENPEDVRVYSITKNYIQSTIDIKGTANDISGYYSGYSFNIIEDKLYIGLKYNDYFGYSEKTKDFTINVPCNINQIRKIYLVSLSNEVQIWPVGGIRNERR